MASAELSQRLLAWYRDNQRDLPWRRTSDPYRIWISEMMLQQTQVATVIPYYHRFLATFSDVSALAAAPLDAVLAAWRGLGYYSRARALHRAAQIILSEHGGQIPATYAQLKALPGIGDYTASAIASIAYGLDYAAVDANVRRVLCRITDYAEDPLAPAGRAHVQYLADALLPIGQAGAFNQAMMELGAVICVRNPRCVICPLADLCKAYQHGMQLERPLAVRRKVQPVRRYAVAFIKEKDKLLLARRIPRGLLGGLWELPGGELQADEAGQAGLVRILTESLGLASTVGQQRAAFTHGYTHFIADVVVYDCLVARDLVPQRQWDAARWVSLDALNQFGLTGVTVKALVLCGISLPER